MYKLIDTYRSNPTHANAVKIRNYSNKHPMARCMLSVNEAAELNDIIHRAEFGA